MVSMETTLYLGQFLYYTVMLVTLSASTLEAINLRLANKKTRRPNSKRNGAIQQDGHGSIVAWSYENMKGLDPTLCEHQIHLNKDAKPIQQQKY